MPASAAPQRPERSLFYIDWDLLLQGDPADAVQDFGRWCGGPRCGMTDCCGGAPCAACAADAEALAEQAGAACLAQCPPRDEVDTLCMRCACAAARAGAHSCHLRFACPDARFSPMPRGRHDFCVSAQLHRLGGWGNCSYSPPGGLVRVPANECSCDKALYEGVVALGGRQGFKGNLLAWLSASWGRCLELDASGTPARCLPFRGVVAPRLPPPPPEHVAAAAGIAVGALLPLAALMALRSCRRRRAAAALRATPDVATVELLPTRIGTHSAAAA
jgi:hypothetical protein